MRDQSPESLQELVSGTLVLRHPLERGVAQRITFDYADSDTGEVSAGQIRGNAGPHG
jgi:hypothetical protein